MVKFPYGDYFEDVNIPDANLRGVFEPPACEYPEDDISCIEAAVQNPIGSAHLSKLARGCRSAVIISDDNTRHTPVKLIIPIIERILRDCGVEDIRILVALGTHRFMTQQELIDKFGDQIIGRIPIRQHDYKDIDNLIDMGLSPTGIPLNVNRIAIETDLLIGLGQIVPHRIAGFSGGSKIVLPGVTGAEATAQTHWRGSLVAGEKMLGVRDNPIRAEMDYTAKLCNLGFVVNAVCDAHGRLIGAFAGDFVQAHIHGCELARKALGTVFPGRADIVIADSYPKDIELWQAAKALYATDLVMNDGGVAILVSPCTEGVSRSHPQILQRGYTGEQQTLEDVESGRLKSLFAAAHCLRVGRLIIDRGTGIMVHNEIPKEDIKKLGFKYAETPQQALDMALEIKGAHASVAVLRKGGEVLPVLEQKGARCRLL